MNKQYANLKNDFAFKRVFGKEKNSDILIAFLNDVLKDQLKKPIKKVEFLNTFQDPAALGQKPSVVDVLCRDSEGTQYIIEMQVSNTRDFIERAQFYAAKAFVSQMKEGEKYENLKEIIFLAFTSFSLFPKKKSYKTEHIVLDKETLERDLDKLSFTFVELPKFYKAYENSVKTLEALTQEEKFYYLLHKGYEVGPKELKGLVKNTPIIEKTCKELDYFYWTPKERYIYEEEKKRSIDYAATIDFAKEEGMQKGIEKGIQQGIQKGREEERVKAKKSKSLEKKQKRQKRGSKSS